MKTTQEKIEDICRREAEEKILIDEKIYAEDSDIIIDEYAKRVTLLLTLLQEEVWTKSNKIFFLKNSSCIPDLARWQKLDEEEQLIYLEQNGNLWCFQKYQKFASKKVEVKYNLLTKTN